MRGGTRTGAHTGVAGADLRRVLWLRIDRRYEAVPRRRSSLEARSVAGRRSVVLGSSGGPCENARGMTESAPPPELRPVPGSARGRGRIIVDLSDVVDRATRRRAGVFRRALRREASRIRDPRRIAAILLLSLTFALILSGLIARGEAGGADARALLGRRPDLAQRRRPVPPDRPVPALRLRAVDAAAVRAVGAAAVGRRLVRLAGGHDPAAALDDPLGVPPPAADDGDHRGRARLPVRGQPRHRQHQPPADADAVGSPSSPGRASAACSGRWRPG